jgi:O-antigen/teichoic acid export membrane protein
MISMSGRTRISLANATGVLLINIVLNILLIPRYGILGSAVAVSAAISLINLIRLVEVWSILKLHPYRLDALKPLCAGAAAFFILSLAKTKLLHFQGTLLHIALGTLIFAAGYAAVLGVLGISDEEKLVFNRIKHRILS